MVSVFVQHVGLHVQITVLILVQVAVVVAAKEIAVTDQDVTSSRNFDHNNKCMKS